MSDNNNQETVQTNAGKLFDKLIAMCYLKNDADLCRFIGMNPPNLSKMRNGVLPVGATAVLRIHEGTGMPVADIRAVLAGSV